MNTEFLNIVYLLGMLVVLFLLCWLLVRNKKQFTRLKNWVLIPLTFAGGFIVYYVGFNEGGSEEFLLTMVLRSALSSIHMFLLHSDLLEVKPEMHADGAYMLSFSIIHFMAFIISFMVIIQLFGKQFLSWLKLKCSRPRTSYIFFDVNEESVSLAKDLLKHDPRRFILFVDKNIKYKTFSGIKPDPAKPELEEKESLFDQLSRMDVVLLKKSCGGDAPLAKTGLRKLIHAGHAHLFFLSDNEDYNIRLALKVLDEENGKNREDGRADDWNMMLYVDTASENISGIFMEKIKQGNQDIDIRLVNKYNLSAIELIAHYPPVDCVKKDIQAGRALSDFHAMVIGFGQMGAAALRYLTEQGQFADSTFHATVIDEQMDRKQGLFECKYPGLKTYNIKYHNAKVNSTEFFSLLKAEIDTLDYLVVSLGEDELNVKTALHLWHYISRVTDREIHILVNVYNDANYIYIRTSGSWFKNIHIFGTHEAIFTEEVIVNESRAAAAKKIHAYYNNKSGKQDSWKELSRMKKIANLSAAAHIYTKLELMGCNVQTIRKLTDEKAFISYLGKERLENLAQGEHLHWNATLFANEWIPWKLEDILPESTVNKDEKHKKHACLVGWEELKKVQARFGDDYQQYDRDSIVAIYELVKAGVVTEEDSGKSKLKTDCKVAE